MGGFRCDYPAGRHHRTTNSRRRWERGLSESS
jgi:hypothetical protein